MARLPRCRGLRSGSTGCRADRHDQVDLASRLFLARLRGFDLGSQVGDVGGPELAPVLPGLAGILVRHGLAEQTDRTRETLEQRPSVGRIERIWSPTELGEQVLGYYLDAGAEADFACSPAG